MEREQPSHALFQIAAIAAQIIDVIEISVGNDISGYDEEHIDE